LVIVVINVRENIKNVIKRVFYPKNKKNVCKRDKNVTVFLLAFDIEPVDKITDTN